jgi:dihydroorotate dehydrogenase (fumarate)
MDLSTRYLGLELRNPLIASASPLSSTVDGIKRLGDGGVGAIVLYSMFEEQLRQDAAPDAREERGARYLSAVERAVAAVDIPVIASLNGCSAGGWTDYARALGEAGAAAIELNIYQLPGQPAPPFPAQFFPARDLEQRHVDILTTVKAVAGIPVSVKLSPYFSSIGEMVLRLDRCGADGIVLFNRFLQPDIDPETLTVTQAAGLSDPAEGRLPRAWIALLAGRVAASLAATTGVAEPADVARYLLAGADVVMTASALMRHGPGYAGVLLEGLSGWMTRKGFGAVADARGLLSVPPDADEAAYERAGYVAALQAANHGAGAW